MKTVTSSEFQKNFGQFKELAQREPVAVTSNGRESVVLISAADYAAFLRLKYAYGAQVQGLTMMSSWGAWLLGAAQILFIINFFWSRKNGEKVDDNPWEATTLEWAAPTPPPHGNFAEVPTVYRGPYEYSVPDAKSDFSPQHEKEG